MSPLRSHVLILLFLISQTVDVKAQHFLDTLHLKLASIAAHSRLPGFAVAIVDTQKVLYQEGFGFANLERQIKFTTQTSIPIGSISKTFIGVAIMQLVEDGKIELDARVNDILPFKVVNPWFPDAEITVRQLATHTSGIIDTREYNRKCYILQQDYPANDRLWQREDRKYFRHLRGNVNRPMGAFLKDYLCEDGKLYRKKNFQRHPPGSHYAYSNIAATLVALVVEIVAGQPYDEYIQEHVLVPLNMLDSGWSMETVAPEKIGTRYFTNRIPVPKYSLLTYPDGSLVSNCQDLSRYLIAMMNGYYRDSEFLPHAAFSEMMRLQLKGESHQSGIFWSIAKNGRIGHNGGDPGIFTYLQFEPITGVGYVFITNTSGYEDADMLEDFKEIWRALARYGGRLSQ